VKSELLANSGAVLMVQRLLGVCPAIETLSLPKDDETAETIRENTQGSATLEEFGPW